jgi:predicted  nucleic acid-binding Zn-ribbon protein
MENILSIRTLLQAAILVLSGMIAISATAAESPKDKQVRRMQLMLNAAQQEKTDLTTQVDTLKNKVSELESKRAALEKKLGGQTKQLSELTDKQQQADLQDKQQQDELSNKYQESEKKLKQMEEQYATSIKILQQTQRDKEQEAKRLDSEVLACEKKNSQLYLISSDLMDKYKAKGVLQAMRQAEPFTQLEKVKMENLLQEYRDKADANSIPVKSVVAQDAPRP